MNIVSNEKINFKSLEENTFKEANYHLKFRLINKN